MVLPARIVPVVDPVLELDLGLKEIGRDLVPSLFANDYQLKKR